MSTFIHNIVLVKLDPVETKSTGGIVIDNVTRFSETLEAEQRSNRVFVPFDGEYNNNSNYKIIYSNNRNVKKGWIYQDKTHILRDPNR